MDWGELERFTRLWNKTSVFYGVSKKLALIEGDLTITEKPPVKDCLRL